MRTRQLLFTVEPKEPFVVHKVTLTPEQHMKASISKAAAFMRQRLHPLAKAMVIAAPGFITDRHPAKADGFTRRRIVEHRICQKPFQLRVLVFQRLQPLGFGYVHAAELGFPFIDAGIADAVLAATLRDGRASLVLLPNGDDLFVCETVALHSLVLSTVQSLLQNGLFQRGKVTRDCRGEDMAAHFVNMT
ncbi:hypothetical protein ACVI1N_003480 [Sinorhizobium medicae]